MTRERRQDIFLLALVISLFAHVGFMFAMRPQVMAHVAAKNQMAHPRRTLHVREMPARPEVVDIAEMGDIEADKDAPDMPATQGGAASPALAPDLGKEQEASAPAAALPEIGAEPEAENVALSAPKLTAAENTETYPAHLPTETPKLAALPSVTRQAPLLTNESAAPRLELPAVSAPLAAPPVETPAAEGAEASSQAVAEAARTEVLPQVDAAVVQEERQAVRNLLNVRKTRELASAVNATFTSATAGEWTYFGVKLEPRASLALIPKDLVILLDASGSIGGDRLGSCRKAARRILRSATNTGDRFNLVAFRDKYSYAFSRWQACTAASFAQADKWLSNLAAHGRTDVFATIASVLTLPRDPRRPLIALVVTDGEATAGVRETAQILSRFTALNDGLVSVYMYGVKSGANRELIDILTQGNRGEGFVYDGFRWKAGEGIETLSARFRDPVLSDMRVIPVQGTDAEIYPRVLKNLYRGNTVVFLGRVKKGTPEVAFSVRGLNGAQAYEGFYTIRLAQAGFDAELPREWSRLRAVDEHL